MGERHGASRRFRTPPAASAVPLTPADLALTAAECAVKTKNVSSRARQSPEGTASWLDRVALASFALAGRTDRAHQRKVRGQTVIEESLGL